MSKTPPRIFYRCARCGYRALSNPYEDFIDEHGVEGTQAHWCPTCGDCYWLYEETYLANAARRNAAKETK